MSIVEAYFGARRQMQAEEQARQELAMRQAAEQRAAQSHALAMRQAEQRAADEQVQREALSGFRGALERRVPENLVMQDPAMVPDEAAINMAAQGLAAAKGDIGTTMALGDRRKAEDLRKKEAAEFQRLSGLTDEQLAAEYKDISDDPRVPAKVRYDPKARSFVVDMNGQQRTTDRTDAIEGRMAMWRAQNGDVGGGMQRMRELRKEQRGAAREGFKDSLELAKADQSAQQAGAQTDIARGHLGVAQADAGRRAQEFAAGAGVREAAGAIAGLRKDLAEADDSTPEGQAKIAKIQAKLQALQTGTRGAGAGGHDPAQVAAARALMGANPGMDMATALDNIVSKPDAVHKSFVEIGLKEMLKPEEAVKRADVVMNQMGWQRAGGSSRWTRTAGAAAAPGAVPPAAERKVGQTYQTPKGPMVWRGNGWEPA